MNLPYIQSELFRELAAKVKDPTKLLCRRLDMVVSPDQEPCDLFQ